MTIEHCPNCGSEKIEMVRRKVEREFDGKTYSVPGVEYYVCPDCGERVYDAEAARKIQAHSPAYRTGRAAT